MQTFALPSPHYTLIHTRTQWLLFGQHACPTGARCLPNRGTLLAPVGQNCWQTHAQYLHFVVLLFLFPGFYQRMQFLSYEFLSSDISKPSRQLADSWIIVNWLDVRILQQKTRQSDSFFHFFSFSLIPNRSLGLAWILFFRRVDFVWLLMSNSGLLRIKNKQKTPYKKQKTASSY